MPCPLPLRAVVDVTDPVRARRFVFQILLLTHSWDRCVHAKNLFPLEIIFSGEPPRLLTGELERQGARVFTARESVAFPRIPTRNKFLTLRYGSPGRFALLDCDLILRKPFTGFLSEPSDTVLAACADSLRVTDAQWEAAERGLGIRFVRKKWTAPNDAFAARARQLPAPKSEYGYWNGGLVVVPGGGGFLSSWQKYTQRITHFFSGHPLETPAVSQSDQMGLAAAVAEWGRFREIEELYNFRAPHFWLGAQPWTEASAIHLTNLREPADGTLYASPSAMLAAYWKERILKPLDRCPDPTERENRRGSAQACLDDILQGVRASRLDDFAARLLRDSYP